MMSVNRLKTGWFGRLRQWLGFGKDAASEGESPSTALLETADELISTAEVGVSGEVQPNKGATSLLKDEEFQNQALSGAECTETAAALQTAAGGNRGGILSISPAEGETTVRHPTSLGEVAESNHHQVFTDGNFVFDPIY